MRFLDVTSANCTLFDTADGRIPDYHQYRIPQFTGEKTSKTLCMRSMNSINTSRKCLSFNHTFRRQETTHSNVAFPCRWSNESTFEDTPVAMARFRVMRLPWIVARSWSMAHRDMAFVGSCLFSGSFLVNSVDCHDEYELILIIEYN